MNEKFVLTHLIRAGRDALHLEQTLNSIGYKETPYYNLYGEIADAIYALIGEETDSIDESETHHAIHDIGMSDETAAEYLASMLDKASSSGIDIHDTTKEVIEEAAVKRGVDFNTMVKMILGQWAMQEMYSNSVMG